MWKAGLWVSLEPSVRTDRAIHTHTLESVLPPVPPCRSLSVCQAPGLCWMPSCSYYLISAYNSSLWSLPFCFPLHRLGKRGSGRSSTAKTTQPVRASPGTHTLALRHWCLCSPLRGSEVRNRVPCSVGADAECYSVQQGLGTQMCSAIWEASWRKWVLNLDLKKE